MLLTQSHIIHANSPRFLLVPRDKRCLRCQYVKNNQELQHHLKSLDVINRLARKVNLKAFQSAYYIRDEKRPFRHFLRNLFLPCPEMEL